MNSTSSIPQVAYKYNFFRIHGSMTHQNYFNIGQLVLKIKKNIKKKFGKHTAKYLIRNRISKNVSNSLCTNK